MKKWMGPVCLSLAFSLAGTSVIAARNVSGKLGTFTIAAASLFFALAFLLPASARKLGQSLRKMSGSSVLMILFQAVFGIFLFRMFLLHGLQHTSSVEAGILTGATPAITALLAIFLLKEPVNWIKLMGIISTVGGIAMIQGLLNNMNSFSSDHMAGNFLVLCAAASESAFNIISRIYAVKTASGQKEQVNPLVQTTIVSAVAFILCLIPALFEAPVQRLSVLGGSEWLSLLWYGLLVTALAFFFWYAGIKRCSAFTAAAFSGMMPFTSMLLSVIILREPAGWQQWSGGVLVIFGMIMIGTGSIPAKTPLEGFPGRKGTIKEV